MRRLLEVFLKSGCFVLLFACSVLPLAAQTRELLVRVPTLEFFDPSGYVYTVGEPFKINVDYSPLQATGNLGKLRARVFRGTYESLTRESEKRLAGSCVVYFSSVFKPFEYNGGIDFGLNFDELWLHPDGNSSLTEEHYILVFELDGPGGRWLELERNSVGRYFKQGFAFTVQPDHSVKPEEARQLVSEMRDQARQVTQEVARRKALAAAEESIAATPAEPSDVEPGHVEPGQGMSRCWKLRLLRNESSMAPSLEPVTCASNERRSVWRSWFLRRAAVS